jgi:hypothetical protein
VFGAVPADRLSIRKYFASKGVSVWAAIKESTSWGKILEEGYGRFLRDVASELDSLRGVVAAEEEVVEEWEYLAVKPYTRLAEPTKLTDRDCFARGYSVGDRMLWTYLHKEHRQIALGVRHEQARRSRAWTDLQGPIVIPQAQENMLAAEKALKAMVRDHTRNCQWKPEESDLRGSCNNSAGW